MKTESRAPTAGAMRAAIALPKEAAMYRMAVNSCSTNPTLEWDGLDINKAAEVIDRETGCHSMAEALKADDGLISQVADYLNSLGGGPMVDRLRLLDETRRAALEKAGQNYAKDTDGRLNSRI